MANTWSPFIETSSKMTKGSSQGFSKPIHVVFLCTLCFLYYIFMYHIFVECCIKALSFCILASVLYFTYICWKRKSLFHVLYFEKSKNIFWYFIMAYFYHIHGPEILLFTCRYQRFLDSQALFLINRSSKYLSHS